VEKKYLGSLGQLYWSNASQIRDEKFYSRRNDFSKITNKTRKKCLGHFCLKKNSITSSLAKKKEKVTKIGRYLVQKRPVLPKKIKQANI
jgi:hypothetical protein